MKYCTDDGKKIFNTEEEVFEYERKIKEENKKREQLLREKSERRAEIQEQTKILKDLLTQYYEDFGSANTKTSIGIGVFNDICGLLRFI